MLQRCSPFRRAASSPALYMVAGVLLLGAIVVRWVASIGGLAVIRESLGAAAPLVTVPIHIAASMTFFPSEVITIANGALYGFAMGAALSWLAWWTASMAEFGLGRRARKDFDLEASSERMPDWLRRFPVSHPVFLIAGRQIPWLGGHIVSFIPGAAGVKLRRFVWCAAVGILPGSIVLAAIGAGLVAFWTD